MFDLNKMNWDKFIGGLTQSVSAAAECAGVAVDDATLNFGVKLLTDWIKSNFAQAKAGVMRSLPDEEEVKAMGATAEANGKILNPEFLSILFQIGKAILPFLLTLAK